METVYQNLDAEWLKFVAYSPRVALAAVVLLLSYFIGKYFSRIVLMSLRRTSLSQLHQAFFRVISTSLVVFIGLVVALNILNLQKVAVSMMAGGGLTAVVLGFAFREIGENLLAGLFLAFSRPFKPGDIIKTEDVEGEVRTVELRYTHIRAEDGRDVFVPSSQLFNRPVTNFTRDGLRRISFSVGIDYSNDSMEATRLLAETTRQTDGVLADPIANAYILSLSPQYVEIMVFFWVDFFDKSTSLLNIRNHVMNKCRLSLLENGYIVSSETTSNIAIVRDQKRDDPD